VNDPVPVERGRDRAGLGVADPEGAAFPGPIASGSQLFQQAEEIGFEVEFERRHVRPAAFPPAGLPMGGHEVRERAHPAPELSLAFHSTARPGLASSIWNSRTQEGRLGRTLALPCGLGVRVLADYRAPRGPAGRRRSLPFGAQASGLHRDLPTGRPLSFVADPPRRSLRPGKTFEARAPTGVPRPFSFAPRLAAALFSPRRLASRGPDRAWIPGPRPGGTTPARLTAPKATTPSSGVLAATTNRKPMLLFRFAGSFLFRFAERQFLALLFHEPPRSTRTAPVFGPVRLHPETHASGFPVLPPPFSCCFLHPPICFPSSTILGVANSYCLSVIIPRSRARRTRILVR
jgi:hypothetical protein